MKLIALALFGLLAIASAQTGPTFSILTEGISSANAATKIVDIAGTEGTSPADIVKGFEGACWGTDTQGNLVIAGGIDASGKILSSIYGFRALDKQAEGDDDKKAGIFTVPTVTGTMPALAFASGAMYGSRLFCSGGYTAESGETGAKYQTINLDLIMIETKFASFVGQSKKMTATVTVLKIDSPGRSLARFDHRSLVLGSVADSTLKATIYMIGGLKNNTGAVGGMTYVGSSIVGLEVTIPLASANASSPVVAKYKDLSGLSRALPNGFAANNVTISCKVDIACPNNTAFPGAFFAAGNYLYVYPGTNDRGEYVNANQTMGYFMQFKYPDFGTTDTGSWTVVASSNNPKLSYGSVAAAGANVAIVGGFQDDSATTNIWTVNIKDGVATGLTPAGTSTMAENQIKTSVARSGAAAFFDSQTQGSLYVIGGATYADTKAPSGTAVTSPFGQKFLAPQQLLLKKKSEATTVGTVVSASIGERVINGKTEKIYELIRSLFTISVDLSAYGGSLLTWKAAVLDKFFANTVIPQLKAAIPGFQDSDIQYTVTDASESSLRRRARAHGRRAHGATTTQVAIVLQILGTSSSCGDFKTVINRALQTPGSPLFGLSITDVNSATNGVCPSSNLPARPILTNAAAATSPLAFVASAILALAALFFAL